MMIPSYVNECMTALRLSGFQAWAVGGCVRDSLLGLSPHDYDLCTDAKPEQTEAVFADRGLVTAGKKHGTIGVVTAGGVVEITTFRADGSYSDSRHPDRVAFVGDIRQDLARRDFTVNAMAWSESGGYQDPFGGREDLEKKRLRAVGDPDTRFREDALRILRGVRFALRFGLTPEKATLDAMLSLSPLLDGLSRERVYAELSGILPLLTVDAMALYAPILTRAVPELAPTVGFDQCSPHHAYDLYTHISHVVAAVPGDLTLRWAALLHDIGKVPTFTRDETGRGHFYGHAGESARMAEVLLRRLTAPNALREQAVTLIENHMTPLQPERKALRRTVSRLGREMTEKLLLLQEADMAGKGTGEDTGNTWFSQVRQVLSRLDAEAAVPTLKDLAVDGNDLLALGYSGKEIGQCLNTLLARVIDETLPNTREALLTAAERWGMDN